MTDRVIEHSVSSITFFHLFWISFDFELDKLMWRTKMYIWLKSCWCRFTFVTRLLLNQNCPDSWNSNWFAEYKCKVRTNRGRALMSRYAFELWWIINLMFLCYPGFANYIQTPINLAVPFFMTSVVLCQVMFVSRQNNLGLIWVRHMWPNSLNCFTWNV